MLVRRIAVLATLVTLAACSGEPEQSPVQAGADQAEPAVAAPVANAAPSTFEPVPAEAVAGGLKAPCSIDRINGQPAAGAAVDVADPVLIVGGWIANPKMQAPQDFSVLLSGEQTYRSAARTGVSRPDVARVLNADGLAAAGFNARGSLEGVAPGSYDVSLVHEFEGRMVRCNTNARVTIARG